MAPYIYLSLELQQRLRDIKKSIYLKMNGITAESMKIAGINYSKNFGVSLPELKQMAAGIQPDKSLAMALWNDKTRETMMLATYLCPVAAVDEKMAEDWVADVTTLELAESLSRNLLCHISFAREKAAQWIQSDNYWACAVGYFTAAFGIEWLSWAQKQLILESVKQQRHVAEVPVYRAIALFVRKYASNKTEAAALMQELSEFKNSTGMAKRIIYEELQTEAIYRFGL